MAINIEKMNKELVYEGRKFAVQFSLAIAASVGAGVAIANYVNNRAQAPVQLQAPPPQIIYLVPGPAPATTPGTP